MVLEDILLAAAVGVVLLAFGLPIVRFLKGAPWRPKDALAQANERLRIAKLEAEVARVNREAEQIYERLYEETSAGDRGGTGTRIDPDDAAVEATNERPEKEKRHRHG